MERELFARLTQCMYETGQYDQAVDVGGAVIEMNRHYENSHKYVALALKAAGKLDDAVTMMRQVCKPKLKEYTQT